MDGKRWLRGTAQALTPAWLVATSALALAEEVDLVILAGQSNMVGQAEVTAELPGASAVDADIDFYYLVTNTANDFNANSRGTFVSLRPWQARGNVRFGPEMTLGRTLHDAGLNPAIIKTAIGGSDIARWQPGASDFELLRDMVRDGINEIESAGGDANSLGLVWLQGESDVISPSRAAAYAENLAGFVNGFRNQLNDDLPGRGFNNTRVFLVEPADWKIGSNPSIARDEDIAAVDRALRDFAATDPRSWFIPTDDLTQYGDGVIHFGADDQATLGVRVAREVLARRVPAPASLCSAAWAVGVVSARRRLASSEHCGETRE